MFHVLSITYSIGNILVNKTSEHGISRHHWAGLFCRAKYLAPRPCDLDVGHREDHSTRANSATDQQGEIHPQEVAQRAYTSLSPHVDAAATHCLSARRVA